MNLDKLRVFLLNRKLFGGRRWYQYFDFGGGIDNHDEYPISVAVREQ